MNLSLKNENDKYEIGEKIRNRRTALGLSQDDLADITGIAKKTISRHENGDKEMGILTFCQYAQALDADPAILLPKRVTKKPSRNYEKLMEMAAELSEEDLALLLSMAVRMKKMDTCVP